MSWAPTTAAWSGATRPAACEIIAVRTVIPDLSAPPVDTHDVWLRLHLLSHRLIQPHGADMTGVFGLLTNVAWTSAGPVEAAGFNAHRLRAAVGHVTVFGVDKFPRMVDYVIPSGVRIADGDRVRLGAHLAEGTTVMHEGFVNFNAGTLGPVDGRGPDQRRRRRRGRQRHRRRRLDHGHAVRRRHARSSRSAAAACSAPTPASASPSATAASSRPAATSPAARGSRLPDGSVVKARELSGRDGLLFRRNSVSGALEALPRDGDWGALNADLHAN